MRQRLAALQQSAMASQDAAPPVLPSLAAAEQGVAKPLQVCFWCMECGGLPWAVSLLESGLGCVRCSREGMQSWVAA
jgi:hypothetical protein